MLPGNIEDKVVDESINGVKSFLSAVCKPALLELGFLLSDKVRAWRVNNIVKIIEKSEGKIAFDTERDKLNVSARFALEFLEQSSKIDEESLQEMWAGLFSSSCYSGDDENLIYIDLLKKMTSSQVKLINFLINASYKVQKTNGEIYTPGVSINRSKLQEAMGISSVERFESELVYLQSLALIIEKTRFPTPPHDPKMTINTTNLALNLHLKCTGTGLGLAEFWKEKIVTSDEFNRLQENHMQKLIGSFRD
ncbi:Abi-alpha family protein [Vibrio rotiferianus]|uniref:Abi-alpha family protein n=1 Tax=Vibrio rotiferianus TaxID=190895 RepID=UPI001A181452|nr:conserved hypothetical protein [Vibrio rotiferianus]HAS6873269.1 DUF2806 domain-containing protein [Vibrio parahaemolyticus]